LLRLKLFGAPALLRDGAPLTGPAAQRRRLALLALLARAGTGGVSRDRVTALLWPDAPEERARASLAQALHAIRRDLGEERIIAGSADLRLDPEWLPSDVHDFERALAEGDDAAADVAWTGPFLDGFVLDGLPGFARWAEEEAQRLETAWQEVLERRARQAERQGRPDDAVRHWRRLAGRDPLSGRWAQGLVRALAAAGDREAALRHIQVFGALTRDELGLELDERWQQLERELRTAPTRTAPGAPMAGGDAALVTPERLAVPSGSAAPVAPMATPVSDAPAATPRDRATAPTPPAPLARPGLLAGLVAAVVVGAIALVAVRSSTNDRIAADAARTDAVRFAADRRPVLAVGRIAATDAEATLADLLAAMLASSLARLDRLDVVSRERLAEFARARPDSAALVTAARDAGATELLTGALTRDARGHLQLELIRTATDDGTIRSAVRVSAADVIGAVDSATLRLARDLDRAAPTGSLADVSSRSETAWRLYEEANRLIEQGNNATARELYADALREDPDFALAALGLARISDRADWLRLMPRALALADRATPLVRLLVRAEYALGIEDPGALALADSLVARFPAEPVGHELKGRALLQGGDFRAAVPVFERLVAMDSVLVRERDRPNCWACTGYLQLVNTWLLQDSLDRAVESARRWVRLDPGHWRPWSHLADILVYADRPAEARAAIDSMERRGGANAAHFRNFLALQTGDTAAFRVTLEALRAGGADAREVAWRTAHMRRQERRFPEALAAALSYRRAFPDVPRGAPTEATLEAIVRFEMGDARGAAALFDSIAANMPDSAPAGVRARHRTWYRTHAAEARAAAGDTAGLPALADSLALLGQRSAYGRDRLLHHHVRGLILEARGDTAGAIGAFERAIHSPTLGYTRTNLHLARLYLARGRREEARTILRAALRGLSLGGSSIYANRRELRELLARTPR
jgi:DNA-binding SARP family transcriptional activator